MNNICIIFIYFFEDGGVAACSSILDGMNQLCEVKTCSNPASKKCKSCKQAFYCSVEHQQKDWKKHKKDCIPYVSLQNVLSK